MDGGNEWADAIAARRASNSPRATAVAETVLKRGTSHSQPVTFLCSDGETYVVKAIQPDRADAEVFRRCLVLEHVVGIVGRSLSDAVASVALIDVPKDLVGLVGETDHIAAGLAHGSQVDRSRQWSQDREGIDAPSTDDHRRAYADLAVLCGLFGGQDHQLIRSIDADRLVRSFDHGLFIEQGWSAGSLVALPSTCAPDPVFSAHVTDAMLKVSLANLSQLNDSAIVSAVASVPLEWGVPAEDLAALADYIARRRDFMLKDLSVTGGQQ